MSTIEKAAARLVKKPNLAKTLPPVESLEPNQPEQLASANSLDSSAAHRLDLSHTEGTSQGHTCELDFPMLLENGFLVPGHSNLSQNQEFRRIKRPLLLNMQTQIRAEQPKPTNIIYVTSALPAEGKTFVSLNLALSLAGELDLSVMLVDGDATKGDLSRWMGIYSERGLVDLLTSSNRDAESAVIGTNVDRLSVMPCGNRTDNLDELYASDLMSNLIDNLANHDTNRVIVVDGPPLLATTEAAVLAQLMGQTVVVVEANKTPQAAVEKAIGQLEGAQLVSLLLNKADGTTTSDYSYGSGYGSGKEETEVS